MSLQPIARLVAVPPLAVDQPCLVATPMHLSARPSPPLLFHHEVMIFDRFGSWLCFVYALDSLVAWNEPPRRRWILRCDQDLNPVTDFGSIGEFEPV
jgi:hypothetical protein